MRRKNRPTGPLILEIQISSTDEQYDPLMHAATRTNTSVRKIIELLLASCLKAVQEESRRTGEPGKTIIRKDLKVGGRQNWLARIKARWQEFNPKSKNVEQAFFTHTLFLDKSDYDYLAKISSELAPPETIAGMIIEHIVTHSYSWAAKPNLLAKKSTRALEAGIELVNYIENHKK